MGKIQSSLGLLGGALSNLGGGFAAVGGIIQGFAAGGVAGAAVGAFSQIAQGLQWSVKEAGASEQAFKDLQVAVEKSGTAWDTVSNATKECLLNLQKVTVYSDEEVAGALQRLLTFGLSYDQAMKALKETIDLAAAKHMDLETAASLVGKAFQGNTSILARYGIEVQTTKEAAAAFNAVMDSLGAALQKAGADQLSAFASAMTDVGLQTQTASGKMMPVSKLLTEIKDAFKAGTIDGAQFSAICASMGVSFDASNLSAADFQGVLDALNKQFGGTAQEQANTYVGIQERFNNATSELGEKIGTILLPCLSGITEALIPLVEWFGKGVDALQAWLTETAKLPEVEAATEAAGQAWQGLMQWFDSAAKSAQEVLGPALNDLWGALTDLYDALQPIFAAFKELWDAITGSQGDFDAFRMILEVIKLDIEASIEAIKLVTGAVRLFGQEFKAAADFIAPVLAQMVSAISEFLKTIHDSIQAFYMWFVGGSLWQDLWNAVIDIAVKAIATLIGIFANNLAKPISDMLTALGVTIQTGWAEAWSGLSEAFVGLTSSIQSTVASVWDPLSAYLQAAFGSWGTWADEAMASIGVAITTGMENLSKALAAFMDVVKGSWTDFGQAFNTLMSGIANTVVGVVTAASGKLNEILGGMMDAARAAQSTIAGILASISSSIQSMTSQAAAAAGAAGNAITGAFTGAWDTVANAATDFYNWLVGGSLWPDLMNALVDQTQASMDEIKAAFAGGFGDVMLNAPSVPSSPTSPAPTSMGSELASVTLPVTVQVDGTTISRVIERRLVASRQLSAWRTA